MDNAFTFAVIPSAASTGSGGVAEVDRSWMSANRSSTRGRIEWNVPGRIPVGALESPAGCAELVMEWDWVMVFGSGRDVPAAWM